ncbi:small ribosomal subunit protein mS35 [Panulirus ornatus]|uniref:small ribosomal subunit protein mS35 n=1 Tax=Panulirus ornatus TaxID=150431 RepID=UPI003A89CA9F
MALKPGLFIDPGVQQLLRIAGSRKIHSTASLFGEVKTADDEEFRTLELGYKKKDKRAARVIKPPNILPPRYKSQKIDQDWGNVWPTARTFHPATVPLPVRQGYPASGKPTPDKWGNAELMKIPNFLHLTPPVIKRQCEALKKFCTPWPAGLDSLAKQEKHFPVTISKSSYLHSSTTLRDARARIVTLKVSLKSLDLDDHGRDKLLRLVGERYDSVSDCLTLVADRCPLSQQNLDYCYYLLTVLYNESMKTEPWEHEKEVADRERYIWEGSSSQAAAQTIINAKEESTPEEVIKEYEQVVTDLHNEGEDESTISRYRDAVMKLVGLA